MSQDAAISPRGVPPIRTDWLADIAWRLAALGVDHLRSVDADRLIARDVIDGATWQISPILLGRPDEAIIDLDGDLIRTDDPSTADLRIGVELTPIYDDVRGRELQVRVEIGPRGAVTFDPENWMFTFPVDAIERGERPPVAGLEATDFAPVADRAPTVEPGAPADLDGVGAVDLGDLAEIAEGRRTWTTVIGVMAAAPRRRLLGLGPLRIDDPFATLTLTADGALEITPLAPIAGDGFAEVQPASGITIGAGDVVIDAPDSALPGGRLTITGPNLRAAVHRVSDW